MINLVPQLIESFTGEYLVIKEGGSHKAPPPPANQQAVDFPQFWLESDIYSMNVDRYINRYKM